MVYLLMTYVRTSPITLYHIVQVFIRWCCGPERKAIHNVPVLEHILLDWRIWHRASEEVSSRGYPLPSSSHRLSLYDEEGGIIAINYTVSMYYQCEYCVSCAHSCVQTIQTAAFFHSNGSTVYV